MKLKVQKEDQVGDDGSVAVAAVVVVVAEQN